MKTCERPVPILFSSNPPIEDLSFLRADGRPWFVTITHEKDAFFKLDPEEIRVLEISVGAMNLILQGDDVLPDEKY